jgi:hypothetical protein
MKYIVILIIVIICIIIGIYKIKYPFWSIQPVFHYHNLIYWMSPPGIIQHDKPEKNKFYNEKIELRNYFSLNYSKKIKFVNFIRNNFSPHKYEYYNPTENGILNYLKYHNYNSYITFKMKNNKILGCMTSRPLMCFFKDNNNIYIYYIDFLCIDKNHRKRGIASEIIYTTISKYGDKLKNTTVALFKREGERTLIVPLTSYYNYAFDIESLNNKFIFDKYALNNILINKNNIYLQKNVIITKNNMYLLKVVWDRLIKSNKFDCLIIPNFFHVLNLIIYKEIYASITIINKKPYNLFFFRNTYTTYYGKKSLECICSYKETNNDMFTKSFFYSLSKICKIKKIGRIFIENISDNNILINNILKVCHPERKITTSYYFYNYLHKPFISNKVLILN